MRVFGAHCFSFHFCDFDFCAWRNILQSAGILRRLLTLFVLVFISGLIKINAPKSILQLNLILIKTFSLYLKFHIFELSPKEKIIFDLLLCFNHFIIRLWIKLPRTANGCFHFRHQIISSFDDFRCVGFSRNPSLPGAHLNRWILGAYS